MSHLTHKLLLYSKKTSVLQTLRSPVIPEAKSSGVLARQTTECTDVCTVFFFLSFFYFSLDCFLKTNGAFTRFRPCSVHVQRRPPRQSSRPSNSRCAETPPLAHFSLRPSIRVVRSMTSLDRGYGHRARRSRSATGASVQAHASLVIKREFQSGLNKSPVAQQARRENGGGVGLKKGKLDASGRDVVDGSVLL